ncbi:MAG: DNA cytosine methyltransferase [Candidatus Thiodiazotropha sp.]
MHLILSVFPGIDLLGRAFEDVDFCVVRGPDLITGGDIRNFTPPSDVFSGVIGGPPCQDFSRLNRSPGCYGFEMLDEYCRVVADANPEWFLYENVVTAPDFEITGYAQQRFSLDLAWFSDFSRRRDFVFGSRSGVLLNPMSKSRGAVQGTCVTGSDERSFSACCEIQGLPADFDIPFFSLEGKKQAVANAVPLSMGKYVAGLIKSTLYGCSVTDITPAVSRRRCACGCGRVIVGRARYRSATCRKRAQRARDAV